VCSCMCGTVVVVGLVSPWNYACVCVVVRVELWLLLLNYCRRGTRHV